MENLNEIQVMKQMLNDAVSGLAAKFETNPEANAQALHFKNEMFDLWNKINPSLAAAVFVFSTLLYSALDEIEEDLPKKETFEIAKNCKYTPEKEEEGKRELAIMVLKQNGQPITENNIARIMAAMIPVGEVTLDPDKEN